jgi:hypothetical protein
MQQLSASFQAALGLLLRYLALRGVAASALGIGNWQQRLGRSNGNNSPQVHCKTMPELVRDHKIYIGTYTLALIHWHCLEAASTKLSAQLKNEDVHAV